MSAPPDSPPNSALVGQGGGEGGQGHAVDQPATALGTLGGDPALVDPPADGVGADPQQLGRLADLVGRHQVVPAGKKARRRRTSWPAPPTTASTKAPAAAGFLVDLTTAMG